MASIVQAHPSTTTVLQGTVAEPKLVLSGNIRRLLNLERQYVVGAFDPVPGFFVRGNGAKLWVSMPSELNIFTAL